MADGRRDAPRGAWTRPVAAPVATEGRRRPVGPGRCGRGGRPSPSSADRAGGLRRVGAAGPPRGRGCRAYPARSV